jgi:hypothetical protein
MPSRVSLRQGDAPRKLDLVIGIILCLGAALALGLGGVQAPLIFYLANAERNRCPTCVGGYPVSNTSTG